MESAIRNYFNFYRVHSITDLLTLLEVEHIFCILIGCDILEKKDIFEVEKICSAARKIPCLVYGQVDDKQWIFALKQKGVKHFVPYGNTKQLLQALQQLKEQATFRFDLSDFGIDLNQCEHYWTRKFLNFILKDYHFLKYRTIKEIAKQLTISPSHLFHCFKKDYRLSPKQLLLCLQNYYAAYLLDTTEWSTKNIAQRSGFANEHELFKSFRHKTGVTVLTFRREKHWRDYPRLCMENMPK